MKPNKNYLEERRNNKKYWAKRSIIKTERFIEDAEKVAMELETGYLESARIINQEIRRIFSAFENAFDLSQAEAERLIDRAGNKPPSKAILQILSGITDPEKRLALEAKISAPAYKYRLDRLDKLNKQAKDLCKGLYGLEYATDSAFLATEMEKAYNYTIFDLQQGTGISGAFDVLPKSRIEQTLKTNWRGKHFSSRIWGNTQTLADELRQSMIQSFITGESERKAAARIQERFNVGAYEARRLIRTENTYVTGQAELEAYKASGVTKYEYASLIDDRTSLICERLDGKIYEVAKAKPGVNYPPMHPFCRSSTIAVLPSEEELDKGWDTFKADNVPQDMTFDEWLDKLEPAEDGKLVFKQKTTAKSDFKPAKTIEEAEKYAERFVSSYKSKYSGNISFKGMDVDHANKVNKVLTEVYDKFDIDVHDNITVMNFRESKWKSAVEDGVAAAYQWGGNGGSLYFNQKLIGTTKTETTFKQNADKLLKKVLDGADEILQKPNLKAVQRDYIESLVKSGRQCVAQSAEDFTECTIVHELGHSLDNKLFRKRFKTLSNPDGFDIRASMERYASNISGYATSTKEEYIAESFAAWWYGMDDIVDPELARIFMGSMKK